MNTEEKLSELIETVSAPALRVIAPSEAPKTTRPKRIGLSKRLRFEVFKRDSFTCQYCGRKAPDVLLEADHLNPVSRGGKNTLLNLITSCEDCNSGKTDKTLSETAILDKQRAQLEGLQKRREQIDMMFKWQEGVLKIQDEVVSRLHCIWKERVPGFFLNETGLGALKKLTKTFEIAEIISAIQISSDHYLRFEDGKPTKDSVELAWSKIGGVCRTARLDRDNPGLRELYYIRGIVRNRFQPAALWQTLDLLRSASDLGVPMDDLLSLAKTATSYSRWRSGMDQLTLTYAQ